MKVINKKARFDYEIVERIEAGVILTGAEAKAVRAKKVDFQAAYVRPIAHEIFVINLHIGAEGDGDPRRSRKLLLNKNEILAIELKLKAQKLTAVPLSLYTKGRRINCELGLVRGKREHEKRAQLKIRDIDREIDKELSSRT